MRIGVALGSNLGDRLANLRAARKAIADLTGAKGSVLESPVYETEPVGCEPGAGKFLNAVLEIEYNGDPTDLLQKLIRIEESLGRDRNHARNVSRKIDIDLLYAGELNIENEQLQLPHPRLHLRKFVLQPLADFRPELILPNQTKTVRELLAQTGDSTKVTCFAEKW
jgi:2-amino-4-hydroxy-6-hydroxymethyldihydropteridine diphosphokinase